MAHIEKFKAAQVNGVLEHNARTDETRPHNHSNEDIDTSRTKDNYELHSTEGTAQERFHARLKELHVMKRDDVTVLDGLVVTLPKDVKPEDERKFFGAVYACACEDYGKQNIINATVHKDETSPHIHIGFIPVVQGKLRNGTECEKVRHSSLITKTYLDTFHQRLSDYVSDHLGYEAEILNGATANGNKTVQELKAERAAQRAAELERKVSEQEQIIEGQQQIISNLLGDVPPLVLEPLPPKPTEEPRPREIIQGYPEDFKRNKREIKEWEKAHKVYERKTLPAWESECAAIETRNAAARQEWESKYLTADNLHKARQQIAPALSSARSNEQIAEAERRKAAAERKKAEEERAKAEAERKEQAARYQQDVQQGVQREIDKAFNGVPTDREERLEQFCEKVKFPDGQTVLDKFEEQEESRRQQLKRGLSIGR